MAKVKIQGHASGTGVLTVTSPNTSTDRTITLPDFTGTLLTSTVRTATNEEDAILIEQSDGTDVGSLRINNGSFLLKGKHSSNPVQIQTHDGNEDIEVDPDGFIKFETGGSERMRLTDNGLTFNGDTAAANALDDYEEGTFTPTAQNLNVSLAGSEGSYTKVGRLVTFGAKWEFQGTTDGSNIQLNGLPFTVGDTQSNRANCVVSYINESGTGRALLWQGTDRIQVYDFAGASRTYQQLSGKLLFIGGSYYVD